MKLIKLILIVLLSVSTLLPAEIDLSVTTNELRRVVWKLETWTQMSNANHNYMEKSTIQSNIILGKDKQLEEEKKKTKRTALIAFISGVLVYPIIKLIVNINGSKKRDALLNK